MWSPVDPSFRALSGRFKFTVRRHEFDTDSLTTTTGDKAGGVRSVWSPYGVVELAQEIQTPMAQGRSNRTISMNKWIRASRLSIKNSLSYGAMLTWIA